MIEEKRVSVNLGLADFLDLLMVLDHVYMSKSITNHRVEQDAKRIVTKLREDFVRSRNGT